MCPLAPSAEAYLMRVVPLFPNGTLYYHHWLSLVVGAFADVIIADNHHP
jgi:hypothetical protein